MRRRARFLRKARELAYRDLGGLVFDLHRFGQRNDPVVLAKLATLGHIDAELRALEQALHEIRPVTVLREVGIAACPRCAAIHGSDDRFCPGCGLAFDAGADRPLSTAPVTRPAEPAEPAEPAPASTPPASTPPAPASAPPASTPLAPASAPPASTPPAPASAPEGPARPAGPHSPTPAPVAEPVTSLVRPVPPIEPTAPPIEPTAPPIEQTAPPVAARPAARTLATDRDKADDGKDENESRAREEQPTQILRPPARGA